MATPVIPAAPAAAASPSPAPSSAPVSTPAPAATPTPAPVVVPTPDAPVITPDPVVPAAPADGQPAPVVPDAPTEPNQDNYSQDAEGLEQFLNDREKWKQDHPEADKPAEVAPADGQQPGTEESKPADEPAKPAEAATPSPQKLDEWTSKDPAFKAALEANPELKGELFALARQNERAKPILDIISTPEEATFAVENANAFVSLRTGLMLSVEDPARLPETFDSLQDLFRVKDASGNYVKDAAGNVQMAEDYALLRGQFMQDGFKSQIAPLKTKLEELRARVENGVYPNAGAKAADEKALEDSEYAIAALEYSQSLLNKAVDSGTQLPELPDDATPAQKELQEKLKKQIEDLDKSKQDNTKEQRTAKRAEYRQNLNKAWGSGAGKMIDEAVAQEKQAGGFIPDFVLQEKWIDPKTGQQTDVRSFGMNILLDFNRKVMAMPSVKNKMAELEMMPPGPESVAAAANYYADLRTNYLPDIIRGRIKIIQDGILKSQGDRQQQRGEQSRVAGIEPQSGATPQPSSLSSTQLRERAQENAAKLPGYESMSGEEKLEAELQQRYKLRGLA